MFATGVAPLPPTGIGGAGVERHVYDLANALAQIGHKVHLICDPSKDAYFHENVTIHRVYAPWLGFHTRQGFYGRIICFILGFILTLRSTLATLFHEGFSFDVVHGHEIFTTLMLIPLLRLKKLPLVFTVHSPQFSTEVYSGIKRCIRRIFFLIASIVWRNVDHLIVLSELIRWEMIYLWGVNKRKITLIPQLVDTEYFSPSVDSIPKVKEKYGIKGKYLLYVGHLSPIKGVQQLIRAIAYLKSTVKDIMCVIVGGGPQKNALISLARELGISDKIIFTGRVSLHDLRRLYAGASFFVFPTLGEASPITIVEAMSSGLPIIATRVSGISDIIKDGYNGFLVEPGDVKNLRCKIKVLWENDDLCSRMGSLARLTVIKDFGKFSIAKKTETLYKNLLNMRIIK
jgi:1,4-alpha-glucan branching enzyme